MFVVPVSAWVWPLAGHRHLEHVCTVWQHMTNVREGLMHENGVKLAVVGGGWRAEEHRFKTKCMLGWGVKNMSKAEKQEMIFEFIIKNGFRFSWPTGAENTMMVQACSRICTPHNAHYRIYSFPVWSLSPVQHIGKLRWRKQGNKNQMLIGGFAGLPLHTTVLLAGSKNLNQ